MTLQEIKQAVDQGKTVHWFNAAYTVIKDKNGQYLIKNGDRYIGLHGATGGPYEHQLNGEESEFFIKK